MCAADAVDAVDAADAGESVVKSVPKLFSQRSTAHKYYFSGLISPFILMIIGALVIAAWDGIRSGFTFWQFFIRFLVLFTVYKVYDMVFFDYFWLLKFRFFQYYYPEAGDVMEGRKYGFNIKSQLLKLLVIFPAVSALAAWICSLL